MKKWLITGGAGFIGGNFLAAIPNDVQVFSVDVAPSGFLDGAICESRVHSIAEDVRNRDVITSLLREICPDAIVHFAAETHVDKSIEDPILFADSNYLGTAIMLESARLAWQNEHGSFGDRLFVQVSTDEVYGDHEAASGGKAFDESSKLNPSSPYSASKAAGDLLALAYHRTYGFPVVVTRSCNNYGPGQSSDKLIPKIIRNAIRHEPVRLYGDGLNLRDWLYVADHCQAILGVLAGGRVGEIYNLCTEERRTNLCVAREVLRVCREQLRDDLICESLIELAPDRLGHDRCYDMSSEKARRLLGWQPTVDFEDGLLRTVLWYLDHPDFLE